MSSVRDDTIGGFNTFIEEQRKGTNDQVYVITQFDNEYDVMQDGVELDDVITLSIQNYVPRGSTALLDAMGRTISAMDSILDGDRTIDKALLVVLTDGHENASREFTRDQVFKLIEERSEKNWDFSFLGAGQDAIGQASSLGIRNSIQYSNTGVGTTQAFNSISRSVSNYSNGGSADLS
jgi:Mg-chelatase subunit ChlD